MLIFKGERQKTKDNLAIRQFINERIKNERMKK